VTVNNQPTNSLWLRLWQPFFRLSVYKKFLFILISFLIGYFIIGIHSYAFVQILKKTISTGYTQQDHLIGIFTLLDTFLVHNLFIILIVMAFLSLTSFLCARMLVNFLDQMICSLQTLLKKSDTKRAPAHGTAIPVITQDKIGEVAALVNGLTSHIRNISVFRRTIESDETIQDVYKRLAYIFKNKLQLNTFVIWEVMEKDDAIEAVYTWPPELKEETCILMTSNLCRARRTGEVVSSVGFSNICPVFPLADVMTHTCVPMVVSGNVLGVVQFFTLFVDSTEREEELRLNLHLAGLYLEEALPILYSKRLAINLQDLATKDALTGLANRNFLKTSMNPVIAGLERRKSTMGMLMCDLDLFRKVNDKYDHYVGDQMLKTLATILLDSVRKSDIIIRYGGEEFLILLTDCEIEKAVEVAEKLRITVEEHIFRVENLNLRTTLSIGVAILPVDGEEFWSCIKRTDTALHNAKENGRNQVVRFEHSTA
jgi:diguanylate cyclase (GGDEF)-like protein